MCRCLCMKGKKGSERAGEGYLFSFSFLFFYSLFPPSYLYKLSLIDMFGSALP